MKQEQIWLSALLHDIGKFYQRTKEKPPGIEDFGADDVGKHGAHAKWSLDFISRHVPQKWREGLSPVLYHHKPVDLTSKIVAAADRLSSGERHEDDNTSDPKVEPLLNIFSRLADPGHLADTNRDEFTPLKALSVNEDSWFPVKDKTAAVSSESYASLWQEFISEAGKIGQEDDFNQYYDQLSALLEKYTMTIPSAAYQSKPDISLYHHAKSAAAIASCLGKTIADEATADRLLNGIASRGEFKEPVCTLLGGDISGIQDFIYSVSSSGALRSLKGRSYYLQLLGEGLSRWILLQEGLPLSNLVYCGGGHFYLLLPADQDVNNRVAGYRSRIDEILFENHRGKLSLALESLNLAVSDFDRTAFGSNWTKLTEKLGQAKKHLYRDLIKSQTDVVLGPYEIGGERASCEICGHELEGSVAESCDDCKSFEDLGSRLAVAAGLTFDQRKAEIGWQKVLATLGMTPWLLKEKEAENCPSAWWKIGNADMAGLKNCRGFMMLARQVAKGSLEEIADRSTGIQKWGILRADVDHLGKVFTDRLGDDRTFSRVSMLSYQLGYFFNNWVDRIAARPKYNGQAYVIYSGGDDLSILGSWSALLDLAMDIRQEFSRFTAGMLTISAGIYLAPSAKFPVYQAAKEAGELVDKAKDQGRDRIAIFGRAITWEEFAKLKEIATDIESLFAPSVNLPRSLFSTLYSSWEDQEGDKVRMNRIWRLFYAFGKMKERVRCNDSALKLLTALEQKIMINQNSALRANLDVAVRWAEYLTREKGENR